MVVYANKTDGKESASICAHEDQMVQCIIIWDMINKRKRIVCQGKWGSYWAENWLWKTISTCDNLEGFSNLWFRALSITLIIKHAWCNL